MPSAFDGYYPDGYDDGDQSGTHAGTQPRMICEPQPMTDKEYYDKMFAIGHKPDCNWSWDQYWWECNCGLIDVAELKAEQECRRVSVPRPNGETR